ncbi:MAG: DUF131 domain-containing protein [Candidatus Altiarchaeota archaeon]|nr:DUF131 domain-containing protein [Candidatus Altiarchaeota archaeon]
MENSLILAGILLILLGFVVVITGILLNSAEKGETIRGGAVIFIGPIPVALGTDKGSMIAVSILMLILMIAAWFLFYRG